MIPARLIELEHLPYAQGLELMRGLVRAREQDACPEVIILAEHEPVITLGRRGGEGDLLLPPAQLAHQGVALHRVERGGLATCHGPGQLVLYPICHLARLGLKVTEFVDCLIQVGAKVVSQLGLEAGPRPGHPGVWVGARKVGSVGLHIKRGITSHGLALNYGPLGAHFGLINPCGLSAGSVVSLHDILGRSPDPALLRQGLVQGLAQRLDLELSPWDLEPAMDMARRHMKEPPPRDGERAA